MAARTQIKKTTVGTPNKSVPTVEKQEDLKNIVEKEADVSDSSTPSVNELMDIIKGLSQKIEAYEKDINSNSSPQYVYSPMDEPCTIIHMMDCTPGLETTIYVDGIPFQFSNFGESKKFTFRQMQQLTSIHRTMFNDGKLMLGDDCADKLDALGIKSRKNPMSINQYNRIAMMTDDEFEELIKTMNSIERAHLATMWIKRFRHNEDGFNSKSKIFILDRYTEGLLNTFIRDELTEKE